MNLETKLYDVAVIGAGVFGAWIAHRLRQARKNVLLIDAFGPGNSRSSSGGESRIIRMGYGQDEIYSRSAERSTTTELHHRYPQIALHGIVLGVLEPNSGVLMARRAVQAVVREAVRAGVEYLQAAVFPPAPDGRFDSLRTTDGKHITASAYVFACGPWLPKLFPKLLADRIHPTRQEVFFLGVPAGDTRIAPLTLPTLIDFKDEAYVLPDLEGRGVKIAIDRHGPSFDPDDGDRVITQKGLAEVRRYIRRRIPALKDAAVTETRICQYENTSNGDFLIDRHPDFENVWLVGGGSGHGFKHGPAVGEYVAQMISGNATPEPRFSLATKERVQERKVF